MRNRNVQTQPSAILNYSLSINLQTLGGLGVSTSRIGTIRRSLGVSPFRVGTYLVKKHFKYCFYFYSFPY